MYLSVLGDDCLRDKRAERHTGVAHLVQKPYSVVDVALQRELAKRLVIQYLRQGTQDRVLECCIVAHETYGLVIEDRTKQDIRQSLTSGSRQFITIHHLGLFPLCYDTGVDKIVNKIERSFLVAEEGIYGIEAVHGRQHV